MIKNKTLPHAIFLDIDGTLMENGKAKNIIYGDIPERSKKAIIKAQSLGHKVLINTGRGYSCLPEACFDGSIKFDGFITALGSHVEVDGKTVFNRPITPEHLDKLVGYVVANDLPCRFQGYKTRIQVDSEKPYPPVWTPVTTKESFYEALGDDRVSKITIDRDCTGDYRKFISEMFSLYLHTEITGEAAESGCSKSLGMMIALDVLGIPVERSIAMGDSINDIDMLRAAGTSVATANASDEIKSLCDMVTLSAVEGGVGAAIEELLL